MNTSRRVVNTFCYQGVLYWDGVVGVFFGGDCVFFLSSGDMEGFGILKL